MGMWYIEKPDDKISILEAMEFCLRKAQESFDPLSDPSYYNTIYFQIIEYLKELGTRRLQMLIFKKSNDNFDKFKCKYSEPEVVDSFTKYDNENSLTNVNKTSSWWLRSCYL